MKLRKYENLLEIKSSTLPYVAIFLNPALKMSFFKEHEYPKPAIRDIQKSICGVFEKQYERGNTNNDDDEKPEEESQDEFFDYVFQRAKVTQRTKRVPKIFKFPVVINKCQ